MKQASKVTEYPAGFVQVAQAPEEEESVSIDLRSILGTIWRGKYIIGVCTLIAIVLAVLTVSQLEQGC